MRILLINSMLVFLFCVVVVQADILYLQDQTPDGNDPKVLDNCMGAFGMADLNIGVSPDDDLRMYPDVNYPSGYQPQHVQLWFDVSSLNPYWTINSATMGFYFTRVGTAPAITGYKLSRFKPGKDWIEGIGDWNTANPGEPSWNSQKHNLNPAWQTPGASGDNDVDKGTTITWNKTANVSEWITFDVKTWVEDWVKNGYPNNGMLQWGGTGPSSPTNNYYRYYSCEQSPSGSRPYLTIDYTVPEPVTVLLLAVGLVPTLRRRRSV